MDEAWKDANSQFPEIATKILSSVRTLQKKEPAKYARTF